MKALKPWQKWVLRSTNEFVRFIIWISSAWIAAVSGVALAFTLAAKMGLDFPNLERDASAGYFPERIMVNPYVLYWLIPFFAIWLYLFCKMLSAMAKEDYLSEAALQEARNILKDYPEYTDVLDPLVQETIESDDGRRLVVKNQEVRKIICNRKILKTKEKDIGELKGEINRQEKNLRM